ncbi:hypothetical protein QFZ94_007508 [Paraburkholderia sp. JPY465]|uniref:hypothetical protein n=1 Tax=Paraburkholderia sp. JPY465 TaxID=3042285 RepID=UPI003D2062B6
MTVIGRRSELTVDRALRIQFSDDQSKSLEYMLKRRLPRTLKKIGFTIVSADRRTFFERADPIVRHPILLTFIAFILTGVVGTWLSDRYQREQHEQEAMRKTMDEVRLSIDTTNQAFDDYLNAAAVVDGDLTSNADSKRLDEDREIFWKARRDLDSKLAIETPRIRQAMPFGLGGAFQVSASLMRVGAWRISDCLDSGKVVDAPNAGLQRKKIECPNNQTFSIKYADEQISKVQICVAEFFFAIRPSPFDDLDPKKIASNVGHAINNFTAVCNGVTMLGLSYDATYGKYKAPNNGPAN